MSTLNQIIEEWRRNNQTGEGHNGIMSKLTINGSLYDIKDPAVEELASAIESRLASVEGKSWKPVVKGADQPKYATAVTQSTDGSIEVTYGSLRDTALNVTASNGVFITGVSQATDGVVSVSTGSVDAQYVGFTGDGWTATDAQNAIKEALSKAIGTANDSTDATTIYGAKAYAEYLANTLVGEDWTANAKTIKEIIAEINGSSNGWETLVDKLKGLGTDTVITYVEKAVADAEEAAADAIAALDATEASVNGKNVQVQVTQQDGKISGVSIITDNTINAGDLSTALASAIGTIGATDVKGYVDAAIAGAASTAAADVAALSTEVAGLSTDLAALTTDIVNNEQVVATALNDLNTNKADKSAFATGAAVIGLTTTFAADTLTITTATGAVWIPA